MMNMDGEFYILKNEKEFNKEEFINEFTYAYEDIYVAVPPSLV